MVERGSLWKRKDILIIGEISRTSKPGIQDKDQIYIFLLYHKNRSQQKARNLKGLCSKYKHDLQTNPSPQQRTMRNLLALTLTLDEGGNTLPLKIYDHNRSSCESVAQIHTSCMALKHRSYLQGVKAWRWRQACGRDRHTSFMEGTFNSGFQSLLKCVLKKQPTKSTA